MMYFIVQRVYAFTSPFPIWCFCFFVPLIQATSSWSLFHHLSGPAASAVHPLWRSCGARPAASAVAVVAVFAVAVVVAPSPVFAAVSFADPGFVDPGFADPDFVDPDFADLCFVDLCFVVAAVVPSVFPLHRKDCTWYRNHPD
ncbi:MAG: hypothetical protein U5Q03_06610 [Bacteroidota bacterium]|nr:hypothetical protein [Bacteroidota bacterium]